MKKIVFIMMLLTSIISQGYAQKVYDLLAEFEVQDNPFHRKFVFDLGKKDIMQVEIYALEDLAYLQHTDSIIDAFIKDIETLKDSIPREIYSRTIEYSIDAVNLKRISISKHGGPTSNFVISNGETSLLKMEQDTIVINGVIPDAASKPLFKGTVLHYFRLSFFLNDLNNLAQYKGQLDEKIGQLRKELNGKWELNNGVMQLRNIPSISAPARRGYIMGGEFISLRPSIDVQNYKDRFVPSLTGGIALVSNKNLFHREYSFFFENHFMFRSIDGKTKTFRNNFLGLSFGRANINPYTKKSASLYPFVSLAYLVRSRGNFFDKNTFKLGLGQFHLFGNYTKVEPGFYFNNFFRAFTPSLRITQHF